MSTQTVALFDLYAPCRYAAPVVGRLADEGRTWILPDRAVVKGTLTVPAGVRFVTSETAYATKVWIEEEEDG